MTSWSNFKATQLFLEPVNAYCDSLVVLATFKREILLNEKAN